MLRKMTLIIAISLAATQAHGTTMFGGDDEVEPAANPPTTTPVPPAAAPHPEQPARQSTYPQCSSRDPNKQFTGRADLVKEMIEDLIKVKNPFGKLIVKDEENNFIIYSSRRGGLLVTVLKEGASYPLLAGYACQAADGIIVKIVHPMQTTLIKVRPDNETQVSITKYENGREDPSSEATFTIMENGRGQR